MSSQPFSSAPSQRTSRPDSHGQGPTPQDHRDRRRVGGRPPHLLPHPLDVPHRLQDGGGGHRDPAQAVLHPDLRELRRGTGARRLPQVLLEQHLRLGRLDGTGSRDRGAVLLRHGVLPDQAHQGHAGVDALHQGAASGGRARPHLPDLSRCRSPRYQGRTPDRVHARQPAHRLLDALFLLQGSAARGPGGGAHGRRAAEGRAPPPAAPALAAGHRLHLAARHHPVLERGLLEPQPDRRQRRASHGVHRLIFQPGRAG